MAVETFDFDGEELDLDIDNSTAEIPAAYYVCEITRAVVTQKYNDAGEKMINAQVGLKIAEGPYEGTFASMYLGLNNQKQIPSRIRRAFFNALTGGAADGEIKVKVVKNTEGKPELADVVGERIGALLKSNEKGFLQVEMDNIVPADEVVNEEEEPF